MNHTEFKAKLLKDLELRALYYYSEEGLATVIGARVRLLRKIRNLTQSDLAELLGTKQEAISRLENGRQLPSLSFLNIVAKELGYAVDVEFIKVEDTPHAEREK